MNNNTFVPDYSFSALHHGNESTEMLEGDMMHVDTFSTTDNKVEIEKVSFRRSNIKEKSQGKRNLFSKLFRRNKGGQDGPRTIHINSPDLNSQQNFMSNSVSTAKYNIITFLPKFLFEEFSKSANVFFLFISGIQVKCGWITSNDNIYRVD